MLEAGKISIKRIATFEGHKDCIYSLETLYNTEEFVSCGADGMVVGWDINHPNQGRMIAQVNASVYAMCRFKDSELIVGHNFEGIHLINLDTGKKTSSLQFTKSSIFDLLIIDDILLAGCSDGKIFVICMRTIKVLSTHQISDKSVRRIKLSPCKTMVAVGCSDCNVYIFKLNTNLQESGFLEKIQIITHLHNLSVCALAWPKNIISGSRDAFLKCIDSQTFVLTNQVVAHNYAINDIAVHQSNNFFASCSMDKTIKIWNTDSLQLLKVIDKQRYGGHSSSINKIIWLKNPTENLLLSCSDDKTICLYRIDRV